MKKLLKHSIILVFLVLSFNSCYDEYLDPVPRTQISDLSAFDTKDRIVAQVNSLYAFFKSGQYLGGRYIVYNSIRSDDFLNMKQNGVTNLATWNHNLQASTNEVQNLWGQVYSAINIINVFLKGLEDSGPVAKNIITQAEFNQYKGEALALRGIAHFHLAQLYAWPYNHKTTAPGVIMRLTAQKSSADNNMARETLAKTYELILKDLDDSEGLLPVVTAGTANSVYYATHIHKNTVIAFKTKVYLHMNDWPKVILEGNKIVGSAAPFTATVGVANAIVANYTTIFRTPFTTSESLFSMPMSGTELPGTQNDLKMYFAGLGDEEYPINEASQTWSSAAFPVDDARRLFTVTYGGRLYINKYITNSDWVPVMRWSEVLLNIAEAEAMSTGVTPRAVAILNAVFKRSNPTAADFVAGNFANGAALAARIIQERGMEFLGEGIKNGDTMRKLVPHTGKPSVDPVPVNNVNYVWPIPQTELNTNALVQQNNVVP
jgi:hypothetical protein